MTDAHLRLLTDEELARATTGRCSRSGCDDPQIYLGIYPHAGVGRTRKERFCPRHAAGWAAGHGLDLPDGLAALVDPKPAEAVVVAEPVVTGIYRQCQHGRPHRIRNFGGVWFELHGGQSCSASPDGQHRPPGAVVPERMPAPSRQVAVKRREVRKAAAFVVAAAPADLPPSVIARGADTHSHGVRTR